MTTSIHVLPGSLHSRHPCSLESSNGSRSGTAERQHLDTEWSQCSTAQWEYVLASLEGNRGRGGEELCGVLSAVEKGTRELGSFQGLPGAVQRFPGAAVGCAHPVRAGREQRSETFPCACGKWPSADIPCGESTRAAGFEASGALGKWEHGLSLTEGLGQLLLGTAAGWKERLQRSLV